MYVDTPSRHSKYDQQHQSICPVLNTTPHLQSARGAEVDVRELLQTLPAKLQQRLCIGLSQKVHPYPIPGKAELAHCLLLFLHA